MDDGTVKIQSGININIKRTDGKLRKRGNIFSMIAFQTRRAFDSAKLSGGC